MEQKPKLKALTNSLNLLETKDRSKNQLSPELNSPQFKILSTYKRKWPTMLIQCKRSALTKQNKMYIIYQVHSLTK